MAGIGTNSTTNIFEGMAINPSGLAPSYSKNPNYLALLRAPHGEGAGRSIEVVGNVPETVGLRISNDFEPLMGAGGAELIQYASKGPGLTNAVMDYLGMARINQGLTWQIWKGTSPLEFQVPFQFNAYNDAFDDVVKPLINMIKIMSPYIPSDSAGASANLIGNILNGAASLLGIKLGTFGNFLHSPAPSAEEASNGKYDAQIQFVLGRVISMPLVVPIDLSIDCENRYDEFGLPMSANANLTLRSQFVMTRSDYISYLFPNASSRGKSIDQLLGTLGIPGLGNFGG